VTKSGSNSPTVQGLITDLAGCFEDADLFYGHGTDNPYDEAAYLVLAALDLPFDLTDEQLQQMIDPIRGEQIQALARQRIVDRKPVAYLVNKAWFAGLPFYVNEHVLIPRSPVAELIEESFVPWVDPDKVKSILDIGTGSACIAIACAAAFTDAAVDAVDISAAALAVARENVKAYDLTDQVTLIKSDLYNGLAGRKYDLIIANPPYVNAEDMASLPPEYQHEPRLGLAAGTDGLDIVRRIINESGEHLNKDGILVVEVGNSQQAMEAAFPDLPLIWLEFERGGDGVFLLHANDL